VPAWRSSVMAYIRAEAQPVDKFGHQPRVYALAVRLGQGNDYDDDVLFAAAWMHDLGVFLGHRPQEVSQLKDWDHVPYTIARTRELLSGWGFPADKLEAVAETIRTHQAKDEPNRVEAVLLRDADILEQLGAIGALRALVKIGRDTRFATFSDVPPILRGAAERLLGELRLGGARALAARRVETLRLLIAAIEEEGGESLF
jgi:uncharacterized protein